MKSRLMATQRVLGTGDNPTGSLVDLPIHTYTPYRVQPLIINLGCRLHTSKYQKAR